MCELPAQLCMCFEGICLAIIQAAGFTDENKRWLKPKREEEAVAPAFAEEDIADETDSGK